MSHFPHDAALTPEPVGGRSGPGWISPVPSVLGKTRVIGKTGVFFGPPLAILVDGQKNTMEISGKLNRTAERYLEILKRHRPELTEAERLCLGHICQLGFMSPLEISELPFEVSTTAFECQGLDKVALAAKLESASFADLVAVVEALGF